MLFLADTLARQGKFDEAEPLGARCLDLSHRVFGDEDFLTVFAMNRQARMYLMLDHAARAEPLADEALKCARRIAGAQHGITRSTIGWLALAYQLQDKHADAAKLIDELLAQPRLDPYSSNGLLLRGRDLIREKKYTEAEQTLGECLPILAKSRSIAKREGFALANVLLGASLLGQKKYANAEALLVKGYEGLVSGNQEGVQKQPEAQAGGPLSPLGRRYKIEALGWLVQLYEEWGKRDEAAKWRTKLEETKTARTLPPSRDNRPSRGDVPVLSAHGDVSFEAPVKPSPSSPCVPHHGSEPSRHS
jgi:eukaryotic-like serine/threonine-protein kinase